MACVVSMEKESTPKLKDLRTPLPIPEFVLKSAEKKAQATLFVVRAAACAVGGPLFLDMVDSGGRGALYNADKVMIRAYDTMAAVAKSAVPESSVAKSAAEQISTGVSKNELTIFPMFVKPELPTTSHGKTSTSSSAAPVDFRSLRSLGMKMPRSGLFTPPKKPR